MVLAFGLLGWVMVQLDWPRPPLLLGLVLGSLAEKNLFLATDNYGWVWVGFPGVLVIGTIILAGILYPVYQRRRDEKRKSAGAAPAAVPVPENGDGRGPQDPQRLAYRLHGCAPGGFHMGRVGGEDWGFRASLFPWVIGFPGIVLALASSRSTLSDFSSSGRRRCLPRP